MRRRICIFLLLAFIGVSTSTVFGASVKFVEKIALSSEVELEKVVDFCVTGDGIFLIPDYIAGDIKLYERDGKVLRFLKTVGSKGYDAPGQFVKPAFCSFNELENKFIILDMGTRRIYLYDRRGRDEFVREKKGNVNEVYGECPRGAYDVQLFEDRLYVAGHLNSDDKFYDFFYMDLSELRDSNIIKAKPKLLLPSKEIYRIDENDDFVARIGAKYLEAIGYRNYFDIEGNFAYFVWMGDLRVTKVDIMSGLKVGNPFGNKTKNYVQPDTSEAKELVKTFYQIVSNRESRDKKEFQDLRDQYLRERRKFSIIRNLFTTSDHVIVVYEGPYKYDGKSENFHAQFYSLDGKFVTEVPFRGQLSNRMCFDRHKKILYSLIFEEGAYFILMYKIFEY
jgi:hypothetical protein